MKESDLKEMIDATRKLDNMFNGNFHYWRYVLDNANSIWKRCPFQVNDKVELIKTPEIF